MLRGCWDQAGEEGEALGASSLGAWPDANCDGWGCQCSHPSCCKQRQLRKCGGWGGGRETKKVRGADRLERSIASPRAHCPFRPSCLGEILAVAMATAAADAHLASSLLASPGQAAGNFPCARHYICAPGLRGWVKGAGCTEKRETFADWLPTF